MNPNGERFTLKEDVIETLGKYLGTGEALEKRENEESTSFRRRHPPRKTCVMALGNVSRTDIRYIGIRVRTAERELHRLETTDVHVYTIFSRSLSFSRGVRAFHRVSWPRLFLWHAIATLSIHYLGFYCANHGNHR